MSEQKPKNGFIEEHFTMQKAAAAVFIAVSGWVGTTVHSMGGDLTRLSTTMEQQVKISDGYARVFEGLVARISSVEVEQSKRASRVYDVEQIQADIKLLKNRTDSNIDELAERKADVDSIRGIGADVQELRRIVDNVSTRFDGIEKDVLSRKGARWNKDDHDRDVAPVLRILGESKAAHNARIAILEKEISTWKGARWLKSDHDQYASAIEARLRDLEARVGIGGPE